jgi:hypothetical protein
MLVVLATTGEKMTLHLTPKSLCRSIAAVTAALAMTGFGLVTGGGSAAAAASLTLQYTCSFPLIGTQNVTAVINANVPTTAVVNHPTAPFALSATVSVPAAATSGLNLVGSKTVAGTASASSTLTNGATTTNVTVPLTIPSTAVPASGTFNVVASGTAPSETLTHTGTATIKVGNFSTTLTPRNASGGTTALGTFTSACTLVAGQNTTLATFPVTAT